MEPVEPATHMWQAVLLQAVKDARARGNGAEIAKHRRLARAYLRAATPALESDLRLVCTMAEFSATSVMAWARKRYPIAGGIEIARPPVMHVSSECLDTEALTRRIYAKES